MVIFLGAASPPFEAGPVAATTGFFFVAAKNEAGALAYGRAGTAFAIPGECQREIAHCGSKTPDNLKGFNFRGRKWGWLPLCHASIIGGGVPPFQKKNGPNFPKNWELPNLRALVQNPASPRRGWTSRVSVFF